MTAGSSPRIDLGQHVLADVGGHDPALGSRRPGRRPGHGPRPGRHVEHHFSCRHAGEANQLVSPRLEDDRLEMRPVPLGHRARENENWPYPISAIIAGDGRPPAALLDTLPDVPNALANGITIYYELSGKERPDGSNRLLCISGTGGDLRQQPRMADPFDAAFEVLAYDQRGLGQTEVPEGPYTMADYADDAAALIDAVGWDDCAVVGISFGGMVAQELAIRHPGPGPPPRPVLHLGGGAGGSSYPLHELADADPDDGPALHLATHGRPLGRRPGARPTPTWPP